MTRFATALTAGLLVLTSSAQAGWFSRGIGSAMEYGPYTGGHGYSYNVAYSYGFAFSAADTWRRDIFAYPGGIYPYRPHGKPIYHRVWPKPDVPYVSAPGPDGLPTLIKPGVAGTDGALESVPGGVEGPFALPPRVYSTPPSTSLKPVATPLLQPVPAEAAGRPAMVRIAVPADAEVWVEKEKMDQTGPDRAFQTPPLPAGKMQIYTVRARWTQEGKEVEQFRVVGVKAGETARLKFTAPAR
jgi:uncharacterized protein (TIGR03000 family)